MNLLDNFLMFVDRLILFRAIVEIVFLVDYFLCLLLVVSFVYCLLCFLCLLLAAERIHGNSMYPGADRQC